MNRLRRWVRRQIELNRPHQLVNAEQLVPHELAALERRTRWRGGCRCGRHGPPRSTRAQAAGDGADHLQAATGRL